MTTAARARYNGHRFPAEIIGHAVWLYFRFPLGLRMVEELLAARGIIVSHETVRQWARKFGQRFANQIRRCPGKASMFSRRQSCRGKSQSPVVRIAEEMETEPSKPIDKISRGEITSHRAVSKENALWPRKK